MVLKVVNLKKERYDVYIGRGSKWGNEFVIGRAPEELRPACRTRTYVYLLAAGNSGIVGQ